jgi:hypothetical protein
MQTPVPCSVVALAGESRPAAAGLCGVSNWLVFRAGFTLWYIRGYEVGLFLVLQVPMFVC